MSATHRDGAGGQYATSAAAQADKQPKRKPAGGTRAAPRAGLQDTAKHLQRFPAALPLPPLAEAARALAAERDELKQIRAYDGAVRRIAHPEAELLSLASGSKSGFSKWGVPESPEETKGKNRKSVKWGDEELDPEPEPPAAGATSAFESDARAVLEALMRGEDVDATARDALVASTKAVIARCT